MRRKRQKVVILCGGKGTRLREETEFRPKPLIQIGGMPILWHIMKIYSHYGYKDFILCLGYKGEMIKKYFLNFEEMINDFTLDMRGHSRRTRIFHHTNHKKSLEDWRITFVETGRKAQTGARIFRIRDYVIDDQEFFLTYGDGVSDINIDKLLTFHKKMKKPVTISGVHIRSVFGLIEHDKQLVKTFREKPKMEDIISGGFFVCGPKVFNYLNDDDLCVFEDKPLKSLADEGNLALYRHSGFWYCMDNQKHVNELNKLWSSKKAPWKIWKDAQ